MKRRSNKKISGFSLIERVKSGRVYVVCKHDEDLGYVRTYAIQLENGKGENVEKESPFIKVLQFIILSKLTILKSKSNVKNVALI